MGLVFVAADILHSYRSSTACHESLCSHTVLPHVPLYALSTYKKVKYSSQHFPQKILEPTNEMNLIVFMILFRYMLRMCGMVLGVFINEKHSSKAAAHDNTVWVSNHCSPFDSVVLQVIAESKRDITFPEGETTTAKSGLLKFQIQGFEQHKRTNPNLPVQPLSLRISRPFPPLAVTTLDTPIWIDALFLLFSPCTIFNIRSE